MSIAQTITTLDPHGLLLSHEVFGKRQIPEYVDSSVDSIFPSTSLKEEDDSSGTKRVIDSKDDDLRKSGDWNMYKLYFSACGRWSTIVFFVLQLIFGVFSTFPSMRVHLLNLCERPANRFGRFLAQDLDQGPSK